MALPDLFHPESVPERERRFALLYREKGEATPAYREVWPERCVRQDGSKLSPRDVWQKARTMARSEPVRQFLEYLGLPDEEIARRVQRRRLLLGELTERQELAAKILAREPTDARKRAISLWREIMIECGAEIVKPVAPGERSVRIVMEDLVTGKAWLELPAWGRIRLLEMAGFPWNDDDPDAKASDLQREILGRDERLILLHGGSGLGKSAMGGGVALLSAVIPNRKAAIFADTFDHCHDEFHYTFQGWLRLFGERGAEKIACTNSPTHNDMQIIAPWNSVVRTFSMERKQGSSALGKEFDDIILGEASLIQTETYRRRIRRSADRRMKERSGAGGFIRYTGRIFMFTSPNWEDGCSSDEWASAEKRSNGDPEALHVGRVPWPETVYMREAESIENPSYSREAFEAARATLPADIFAEQYQGRRMRRSGLIYKEFRKDRHVIPMPGPNEIRAMRLGYGIDTGKHFAAYLCGVDKDRRFFVLGETYTEQLAISDNMEEVKETVDEVLSPAWGVTLPTLDERYALLRDRLDLWQVDNATQHLEDLMDGLDVPVQRDPAASGGKGSVLSGIDFIRELMKNDRFFVVESCEWLLWELAHYIWTVVANRGITSQRALMPQKKNDHACDAVRIVCKPLVELGPLAEAPPPATFEQAWDRKIRHEVIGVLRRPFERAEALRQGAIHA